MRIKKTAIIFFLMFLIGFVGYGQDAKHYNTKKKVAISGYDVVSYFDSKPAEGESKYSSTYQGVIYLFSSSDNKSKFIKEPTKYIPQYGGWCAYAMGAKGDKVKVDPETYKIVSGKLYLFYNFYLNNTLDSWNEDEKGLKSKADTNWEKIIN